MESKELIFKTNLKCGGCVSKISNEMNEISQIHQWTVDLENANKLLKIKGSVEPEVIIELVKSKGFQIEEVKPTWWKKFF